jgi:hypothetical protein
VATLAAVRLFTQLLTGACASQNTTYSQAQLLAASPIQSDLGVLASAGAGENLTVPVFVNDTSGGVRLAGCRQNPVAWCQQLHVLVGRAVRRQIFQGSIRVGAAVPSAAACCVWAHRLCSSSKATSRHSGCGAGAMLQEVPPSSCPLRSQPSACCLCLAGCCTGAVHARRGALRQRGPGLRPVAV